MSRVGSCADNAAAEGFFGMLKRKRRSSLNQTVREKGLEPDVNSGEGLKMAASKKQSTESAVREIRHRSRRKFASEEKVRIVLEGLRGERCEGRVKMSRTKGFSPGPLFA